MSRALTAVTQVCDGGNRFLYDRNGGVILNLETGVETWFGRELWVKPGPKSKSCDFPRQAPSHLKKVLSARLVLAMLPMGGAML